MRIAFAYDKRRVMQALRYHFISRLELRLLIIAVNIFAIGSLVLYSSGKVNPTAFLLSSFLWLFLMVAIWWFLPWVVYKQTNAFQHEFEMEFSSSGFDLQHGGKGNAWTWTSLQGWKETPFFFHLYFDPRSFWLVPKDFMKDEERLQLRAWLREFVQNDSK